MKLKYFLVAYITLFIFNSNIVRSVKLSKHPKLVIFSFDGFRYDYMEKVNLPHLEEIKRSGVSANYMVPQFTSKTFPNHQSIATGLHAENHGIIDNSLYDPLYDRIVSGYNDEFEFWNYDEAAVPLWIYNEWAGDGRISGAQFPGSTQKYGKNLSLPTHGFEYNHELPFKDRMDFVLSWLTNETHPANLVYMYFHEPDSAGHAFGPNSKQVVDKLLELDGVTGYFIQKLKEMGIYDQINLVFLSDHGMEEVDLNNTINIDSLVDPQLFTKYGSSPVLHIWPKNESVTTLVYEGFKNGSDGKNFSVYYKEEIPADWFFSKNRRIAPIVLVSDPGYIFNDRRFSKHGGKDKIVREESTVVGYHGYDNHSPNMRPFFISSGPAFKNSHEIDSFENVDLFPLACKILGFGEPKNNGTVKKVSSILSTSGSASYEKSMKIYFYFLSILYVACVSIVQI